MGRTVPKFLTRCFQQPATVRAVFLYLNVETKAGLQYPSVLQEAAMDSPGKKSDPAPAKLPDEGQYRNPAPKTKEEAGQLAVDARCHELEKITDPKQREKAEKDLRSHAEKTFVTTGRALEKLRTTQARSIRRLIPRTTKARLRLPLLPYFAPCKNASAQKSSAGF